MPSTLQRNTASFELSHCYQPKFPLSVDEKGWEEKLLRAIAKAHSSAQTSAILGAQHHLVDKALVRGMCPKALQANPSSCISRTAVKSQATLLCISHNCSNNRNIPGASAHTASLNSEVKLLGQPCSPLLLSFGHAALHAKGSEADPSTFNQRQTLEITPLTPSSSFPPSVTSSAAKLRSPQVFHLLQPWASHAPWSLVLCFIPLPFPGRLSLGPGCSSQPGCAATALYCYRKEKIHTNEA